MFKSLGRLIGKKPNENLKNSSSEDSFPEDSIHKRKNFASGDDALERRSSNTSGGTNRLENQHDPYQKLSDLNDDLHSMDIMAFLSLRILLETRLGKGAHLTREEMSDLKRLVDEVSDAYKQFSEVVSSCIQYRMITISLKENGQMDPTQDAETTSRSASSQPLKTDEEEETLRKSLPLSVKFDTDTPLIEKRRSSDDTSQLSDAAKLIHQQLKAAESGMKNNSDTFKEKVQADKVTFPSLGKDDYALGSLHEQGSLLTINGKPKEVSVTFENDPALFSLMEKAESHFHQIVKTIEKANKIIDDHRKQINPQILMNAQTEAGFIQKYFVRPRYKELVKGCGSGRLHQSYVWAGAEKPGDAWMNDLLRCYWREMETYRPEWFELSIKKKKAAKQKGITGDTDDSAPSTFLENSFNPLSPPPPSELWEAEFEENDKDIQTRRQMEILSARASNKNILDVIDSLDLVYWAAFARKFPELHTKQTIDIIENAVEKMGGWKLFERFCSTWIRQFYTDFGRSTVTYPLPGCHIWDPSEDSTIDGSLSKLPTSVSLPELNDYMQKEIDRKKLGRSSSILLVNRKKKEIEVKRAASVILSKDNQKPTETFVNLLNGPLHQDGRYWDFLCRAICRELLFLHDTLDEEFDSSEEYIRRWIQMVQESGLLQDGKYYEYPKIDDLYFDENMPESYKNLLHPTLIRLREKAIIINAFLRPKRYARLYKIEQEIRELFTTTTNRPSSSSKKSIFSSSSSIDTKVTKETPKKGHKKAASTGVFDRLLRRKKALSTPEAFGEEDESNVNVHMPEENGNRDTHLSEQLMKAKLSSTSAPELGINRPSSPDNIRKRTRSLPPMPADALNETASVYEDIRNLCLDVTSRKPLPSSELTDEAFRLSEIVIKHYLTEELPAKYQSVY